MRQLRYFIAIDEEGHTVTGIHEFVHEIHEGTLEDPHKKGDGLREYRTSSGERLKRLSDTEYQVVSTGVILRVREE